MTESTLSSASYVGRRGKQSTWLPRQKLAEERLLASRRHPSNIQIFLQWPSLNSRIFYLLRCSAFWVSGNFQLSINHFLVTPPNKLRFCQNCSLYIFRRYQRFQPKRIYRFRAGRLQTSKIDKISRNPGILSWDRCEPTTPREYDVERRGKPSTWLPRQKLVEERIDEPERDPSISRVFWIKIPSSNQIFPFLKIFKKFLVQDGYARRGITPSIVYVRS